jgi:asparagine synthase (glutamine-hydrolysing)
MCGIAGIIDLGAHNKAEDNECIARSMVNALAHRGPDDVGVWVDSLGVALAHRRLSIIELSAAGHQPMVSSSGRYVILFNGEIYNHLELRKTLSDSQPHGWRGQSDTETLLASIEALGFEQTLKQLVGMFAIALWDRIDGSLTLARDRFGEKPLYYGWNKSRFLFGSELKALASHPNWSGEIDRDALALYVRYGYVPIPYSIWKGIKKLIPGTYLVLSGFDLANQALTEPQPYWSARAFAEKDVGKELTDAHAISALDTLLHQSVKGQMLADVPLGAFLSGGIDSSTVVAVMQAESALPVQTFTIGFSEKDYDEAAYAKAVAQHLRTNHTELYVSANDALDLIPQLPDIYDEPFADVSQLPTHLVSRLARQQVTVSLSGDGGDELFGGYNRHIVGPKLWCGMQAMPVGLRGLVGQAIRKISPASWDRLGHALPKALKQPTLGDKLHKLASLSGVTSVEDLYTWLAAVERSPEALLVPREVDAVVARGTWAEKEMSFLRREGIAERMMFNDTVAYLTDDILCKVDRAAMAVGLETRVPLLDHRLAEFALQLPQHMKIRSGQGKWLLRQVLNKYVPAALIDRPKQGFGVPIDSWLRGPLREWAQALLDPSRLQNEGLFNEAIVSKRWTEHLTGHKNWQYWLWSILMFQAWKSRWLPERVTDSR